MKNVLSDMNSFDYAIKRVVARKVAGGRGDVPPDSLVSRPQFAELLREGRAGGNVGEGEVRERGTGAKL